MNSTNVIRNATTHSSSNETVELLSTYTCMLISLPESGIDCSKRDPSRCFKCRYSTDFLFSPGANINDTNSSGHLAVAVLGFIVVTIAMIGFVCNTLIVVIVHRRKSSTCFDFLLGVLAHVDNFVCVSCGFSAVVSTAAIARAMSMYMTLLISLERYLAIAHPLIFKTTLSLKRCYKHVTYIVVVAIITNMPKFFLTRVGHNIYGEYEGGLDVPSLRGFDAILLPSIKREQEELFNVYYPIILIVFENCIINVILLISNVLTYKEINAANKSRRRISMSKLAELQPAQMFAPVVVVFLTLSLWPLVIFVICPYLVKYNFRESWNLYCLITAINSSLNFWIYFRGSSFAGEVKTIFIGAAGAKSNRSRNSSRYAFRTSLIPPSFHL